MKKYSVVDLGTNSARLMIASVKGNDIISQYKTLRTIRIGEGMTKHQSITDAALKRTADTISEYLELSQGCEAFYCFATSAVRDASNKADFVSYIKKNCGVDVDIVSGEDEAVLGFAGSVGTQGGMFDIGGGSTEVMTGSLSNIKFKTSLNIGTVRLLQMFPAADYADPDAYEKAHELAARTFTKVPGADNFTYVGIGGTATALAAIDLELAEYSGDLVQGHVITLQKAKELCKILKSMTKEQRKNIIGLQENRADVIVIGAIIMLEFLKATKSSNVVISDKDNQEGYLLKKLRLL